MRVSSGRPIAPITPTELLNCIVRIALDDEEMIIFAMALEAGELRMYIAEPRIGLDP